MQTEKIRFFLKKNQSFFKQLVGSYASFFVNVAITLWQTPKLLGYFGEELYGIWLLSITIVSFASLSSMGYIATMVNEFSKKKESEIPQLLNNVFFSITLSFLCTTPLYFLLIFYADSFFNVSPENTQILKNVLKINFIYHFFSYYLGFFQAILFWLKREIITKSIIEILIAITNSLGYFWLIQTQQSAYSFYWVQMSVLAVSAIGVALYLKDSLTFSWANFEWAFFKNKFKISFNYFLLGISTTFALWGDSLFISTLADIKKIPSYNIGFRLSDYSIKIIKKIVDTKAPELIHFIREGKYDKFVAINKKVYFLAALLSFACMLGIYFLGEPLLNIWLQNMLHFDKRILLIFAVYILFSTTQYVNWTALSLLGKHKNLSYIVMVEVVVNILLSTVLYKLIGICGISLGTLLSLILCSWWYSYYKAQKEFKKLNYSPL